VSTDSGTTWEPLRSGIPDGAFGLWPVSASPLHLVTVMPEDGSLLQSSEDAVTWEPLAATGLTGDLQGMALASNGAVFAVTADGLFRSDDAALTWRLAAERKLPVAVAVSPDAPGEVTVVNRAGEVFRSTDGGETWDN
jgi:photosystem II stability/assembly factor-like uncharacterized protein